MKQLTIRFYLHTATFSKKRKDYRLYFRVTYDRKSWESSTDHKLKKSEWDKNNQVCKSNDLVNQEIAWIKNRLYEIKLQLQYSQKPISALSIKDIFTGGSEQVSLLLFLEKHLEALKISPDHTEGTVRNWGVKAAKIRSFLAEKKLRNITVNEIDLKFLQKFDEWLSTQVGEKSKKSFERGYINDVHKKLRALLYKAVEDEIILNNPYQKFKMKSDNREQKIRYLTSEELEKIYFSELDGNLKLQKVRDIFVFSAMTGLRYSDVSSLKVSQVKYDEENNMYYIEKEQVKTKSQVIIPLLKWGEEIYKKYKDSDSAEITGRLLPIYSNEKVNDYLKLVALHAGVDKHLTHHMARHTCGTMLISNGVPIEQVAEILGHKKLTTTRIYAKITKHSLTSTAKKMNNILDKIERGKRTF
ncbi:tyrosine-type recombinase/integrase [Flammeovirgaceae bacterium SG7u.111]|nr:tyrosine-type recombinase/integrase [Flammeovirgaceae bacterium SG7u.132]WPO34638.1 tyrosine-type recombinase/integrase [Flammeovirgaceae bacterium SG7u.111]